MKHRWIAFVLAGLTAAVVTACGSDVGTKEKEDPCVYRKREKRQGFAEVCL